MSACCRALGIVADGIIIGDKACVCVLAMLGMVHGLGVTDSSI